MDTAPVVSKATCKRLASTHPRLGATRDALTIDEDTMHKAIDIEAEVDAYSRFLFPCCFVLFSCGYWLFYLFKSDPVLMAYYYPSTEGHFEP